MLFRGKGDQSETSLLQQGAERSQLSCDSFIQGSPSCPLKKAEEEKGRSMFWEASRMQITARRSLWGKPKQTQRQSFSPVEA